MADTPFPDAASLYANLQGDSKSLLKKHLPKDVFTQLEKKTTKTADGTEGGLQHCIRSGCEHLDSGVGLYACDPQAYDTFRPLFDAVIKDYHNVTTEEIKHPEPSWGDEADIKELGNWGDQAALAEKMIVSTRVRVGRSYEGYGFPPIITDAKRAEIERNACSAFEEFAKDPTLTVLAPKPGEHHQGYPDGYMSLPQMSEAEVKQCTEDHFLFNNSDRMLRSAGGYRNWPNNRGIYFNKDKTFLVWCNEEDHLRLISMQKGGNLYEVYNRLVLAANKFETIARSAKDKRLGNLTFCPTNLGTGLRASVHIKIPKLQNNPDKLKQVCDANKLQPRGIHGEHTESVGGVFDISNKERLGLTEWQAITTMKNGIMAIIKAESEEP